MDDADKFRSSQDSGEGLLAVVRSAALSSGLGSGRRDGDAMAMRWREWQRQAVVTAADREVRAIF
uniref:Uncharacterized protein n=1 Tax=Oryza nivara TaxID=4536 RepID=A0A0E0IE79_ORYNI